MAPISTALVTRNQLLQKKLEEIVNGLTVENYKSGKLNLFSSDLSIITLCANYSVVKKDKMIKQRTIALIENVIERFNRLEVSDATFGGGLSGGAWLFQHLVRIGFLHKAEYEGILEEFDDLIYASLAYDEKTINYDLFTGLLGKGVYFLERFYSTESEKHRNILEEIIGILSSFSVLGENKSNYWIGKLQLEDNSDLYQDAIILGFAHGLPSITSFIGRVYSLTGSAFHRDLLISSINGINEFERQSENGIWYPHHIYNGIDYPESFNKRLAWCYGDLGVAYSQLQAGAILKDETLFKNSIKHLQRLADYKDLYDCSINDGGLCHGAAGVGYLFHKCFLLTGHNPFKDAASFWFSILLNFATFPDSRFGGFKTFRYRNGNEEWHEDPSLIYGASGIGLSIIGYLYEQHYWDNCMLL